MEVYQRKLEDLQYQLAQLKKRDDALSLFRILAVLAASFFLYKVNQSGDLLWYILAGCFIIMFILVLNAHSKVRKTKKLTQELMKVNEDEIAFLNRDFSKFDGGADFINPGHAFTYDLDVFGENSLYQYLNRTSSHRGKQKLADALSQVLSEKEIIDTQQSVGELAEKLDWRQAYFAVARLNQDSSGSQTKLRNWLNIDSSNNILLKTLSALCAGAMVVLLFIHFIAPIDVLSNIIWLVLLLNLTMVAAQGKRIKEELTNTTKVERILNQYALLLERIENEDFKSSLSKRLKNQLYVDEVSASKAVKKLSKLFGRMEHVSNIFAGPLLNGLFQYHSHVLRGLHNWRQKYGQHLDTWIEVMAEFEKLNSLANFKYNNPGYAFPIISQEDEIEFENLGHPLLDVNKSVRNSIDFNSHRFFILTGSNMSGKSTFLRTLGINMLLGSIGAPVCASNAKLKPMAIWVSMRLADSLSDSESYFYAEVKRLKQIMDALESESCFVLLDEILRGTNSDDKRNGTVEVIKKMTELPAFGGIATHDLEVCNVTENYSDTLTNKRFEVEIKNEELVFDYKLREGVCQNKSASFIMKKMGVIG